MAQEKNPHYALEVRRRFEAPRQEVFCAWTTAAALEKWFGPSDNYQTEVLQLDLRVGGRYRIRIRSPEGKPHTVFGVYKEVKSPEKLVYTWSWEERQEEFGESLVTVEFHDLGGGTEIVLTHEQLAGPEDRTEHEQGWIACISRLTKAL